MPADVTLTFYRDSGTPVTRTVTVGAAATISFSVAKIPELLNQSFGIGVHATAPIVAERLMMLGETKARPIAGGHERAGVSSLSTQWVLGEGATDGFFDTFGQATPARGPAATTARGPQRRRRRWGSRKAAPADRKRSRRSCC
jgi:hypothetical protein